jgi:PPOX class probable F420-dependent enzyme
MRFFVKAVAVFAGIAAVVVGIWALAEPTGFAEATRFPASVHYIHDIGAFQLGISVTMLLAALWADALAVALAGFLVGNTVHTYNHAADADLGGLGWETYALAAFSVLVAAALMARLRDLRWVIGEVGSTASQPLAPFVRQKTVLLTTYRRDGTPASAPVSIVVDGERAFLRSFEKAWKTRRLARNPEVVVTPSTMRGRPTGPGLPATMRRITGDEERTARTLLGRKYPILHGVVVPAMHRLGRSRTGHTVHFVLTPAAKDANSSSSATARQSP